MTSSDCCLDHLCVATRTLRWPSHVSDHIDANNHDENAEIHNLSTNKCVWRRRLCLLAADRWSQI